MSAIDRIVTALVFAGCWVSIVAVMGGLVALTALVQGMPS